MYPEVVPIDGNIELIQNSGIQFVDYDAMVDWKDKDNTSVIRAIENGYFMRFSGDKNEPLVRLVPKISSEVVYFEPIKERVIDPINATYTVSLRDSLKLYNGVWFPLPYIPDHLDPSYYGPINWVRARVVKVTDAEAIDQYRKAHGEKPEISPNAVQYNEALSPAEATSVDSAIAATLAQAPLPQRVGTAPVGAGAAGRETREYYRVVLAFDTNTQENNDFVGYFAPTERDVESGTRFKLAYTADRCQPFLKSVNGGIPWVNEWAEAIFRDLYQERLKPKLLDEELNDLVVREHEHEAHYLNMLAFLGFVIKPGPVHFNANKTSSSLLGSSQVVDVSLILDIGNARSCGIMVEDHPSVTRGDDDFSNTYVLTLRDLNAPEQVYSEPFVSRIEFSRPDFDYDNRSARSGRPDAFNWPSMVRVGPEAANLAAHCEGNEGITGLTSPKRYLWNVDPLTNSRWIYNNYSYLIDSKKLKTQRKGQVQRAFLSTIGTYFNTEGKAYFALDPDDTVFDNLESCYSNHSTMTFMLIEIIMQAMSQMNSVAQRERCTSKNTPRRLKAIILTTPPSMPAEERELYRASVYEALGILWKSLGFDKSSPREFNFIAPKGAAAGRGSTAAEAAGSAGAGDGCAINPPVPEVYMDWNEAEAGQVVYIYNESQKTFQGNCQNFIALLRRPTVRSRIAERLVDDEGHPLYSARIASLDIGGGTTDLVIKDYSFKRDVPHYASDIIPHDVYTDGFKIAGDDLLHDLIRECIMPRLALTLVRHRVTNFKAVLQELVGDNSTDVRTEMLRSQLTQQLFVKIAYKILFHLENLDPFTPSCIVQGSIREFLEDREKNPELPVTVKRPGPYEMPSPEVIAFVDNIMGKYLRGFSIMNFKLTLDIAKINRVLMEGRKFNLSRVLSTMAEVIAAYDCDLLLLTGRSSKLPAIRSFFLQRVGLPSSRIVPMHAYRCDTWYPFKRDGEYIDDPKTTAAVGALLCYLRLSHDKFPNFRFYSYPGDVTNNAHYVGILDNSNMIRDNAVLYKYESATMVARKNITSEDDEESNFIPYKRESESFKTQLAVELGYRLLDNPDVEATPLYKIEAYRMVDDIKKIKQAMALNYRELSRAEITAMLDKLDFEIQDQHRAKVLPLLERYESLGGEHSVAAVAADTAGAGAGAGSSVGDLAVRVAQDPALMAYKQGLEQKLQAEVQAEAERRVEKPSGLKSLFGGSSKYEEEKEAMVSALYQERYDSAVNQALLSYVLELEQQKEEQRLEAENALLEALNEAIEHNLKTLRERFELGFAELNHKLNIERMPFWVTLRTVNLRSSPYPVPFVKKCLPHLKPVETFELERVESEDGRDYTPYFKMYLKTISGSKVKYFMDSGAIDLKGINPRFIL